MKSPGHEPVCFPTATGILQSSLTRASVCWVAPPPPTLIHVARLRTCHHTSRSRPYPRTYSQPTTTPRPHGASNLYIRPFHQTAHSPSTCSRGVTPAIFQSCTPSHSANVSVLNFSVLKDGLNSRAHLVSSTMLRSTAARIASHLRCVCDACRC